MPKKIGDNQPYSKAIKQEVLDLIENGLSLRAIAETEKVDEKPSVL